MSGNNDGFVPIVGVVLRRTSLGVFLDVKGTGAFVPLTFVSTPSPALEPGSPATLMVLRSYADQKGLLSGEASLLGKP
jgi:hypothetical protein